MKNRLIPALITLLLTFSFQQCSDKQDDPNPINPTDPNDPNTPALQALTGDGAANRLLLTSQDEEVVRVDPNTGKHEVLYSFERYDDVASLDYLDGMMYVSAEDNSVNAINVQTNQLLWDIPLPEYESSTTSQQSAVVKDGVCYAVGYPGVLVAADLSGKPIWAVALDPSGSTDGFYPTGNITVTTDKVIIGSSQTVFYEGEQNYVYVLDKATGKLIWRKGIGEKWTSGTIKLAGNILLVPANDLYALDINTGNLLWQLPAPEFSRGAGSPLIVGDRVLVHGGTEGVLEGRLFCLNLNTGQKLWEIDAGTDYAGRYAPIVVGNAVIGVHERGVTNSWNGRPFVADLNTGKIIWENDDLSLNSTPVFANGRIFFHGQHFAGEGSTDDNVGLICIEAATGKFLWINNYFRYGAAVNPVVVADNGVFRSGSYAQ